MKTKNLVDGYIIPKNDVLLKDIGSTISSCRKKKAMTQTKLGSLMGLKKAQVCKIEKGDNLTISTISRVFSAMNFDATIGVESKINENELPEVLDDIVMTVSEFAKKYGLNSRQAFRYLDTFGGIEHLIMFHDDIKNESIQNTIEDLASLCRRRGGKL